MKEEDFVRLDPIRIERKQAISLFPSLRKARNILNDTIGETKENPDPPPPAMKDIVQALEEVKRTSNEIIEQDRLRKRLWDILTQLSQGHLPKNIWVFDGRSGRKATSIEGIKFLGSQEPNTVPVIKLEDVLSIRCSKCSFKTPVIVTPGQGHLSTCEEYFAVCPNCGRITELNKTTINEMIKNLR